MMRSKSVRSVISRKRAHIEMPALFTSTSMPPKRSTAAFTIASHCFGSVTSVFTTSAVGPHAFASFSSSSSFRAARTTLSPRLAQARATAAPIPLDAPVMT